MLPVPRELRRFLPAHRRGRVVGLLAILSLALGIAGNAVFFSIVCANVAMAVVGVVLLLVTIVACVVPAVRAGRVDPVAVLRVE